MDRVTIDKSLPKLEIPSLFDQPNKEKRVLSKNESIQDQLRFTTESSLENNSNLQKLKARNIGKARNAPTSENWIG
jgi:hypothetical protein